MVSYKTTKLALRLQDTVQWIAIDDTIVVRVGHFSSRNEIAFSRQFRSSFVNSFITLCCDNTVFTCDCENYIIVEMWSCENIENTDGRFMVGSRGKVLVLCFREMQQNWRNTVALILMLDLILGIYINLQLVLCLIVRLILCYYLQSE